MPTGLASTGGFPVASMGVHFDDWGKIPSLSAAFAGKGGQFGPPVGWRPPPGTFGGLPQRPLPPPGPPPGLLPQTNVSMGQFSASSILPGVRPPPASSGQLPSGPPPVPSSGSMFVSPVISETTTLHAQTTPLQDRDQSILGMDDSDGSMLPSPALNPTHPSPHVVPGRPPTAHRPKAGSLIVLGSGNSSSGPSFTPHIPAVAPYQNPPPPPAAKPPPSKPPAPGGHPFGQVDPRDRASQQ